MVEQKLISESRAELLAIYTKVAFLAYAIGIGAIGILIFGWGPMWLEARADWEPLEFGSLLRLCGVAIFGMAGLTVPLALSDNARARAHALPWFAGIHLAVMGAVATQQYAVWDNEALGTVLRISVILTLGFGYLWLWSRGKLHAVPEDLPVRGMLDSSETPAQQLRSAYEEGIRRVAQQEERNRLARDLHDSIKQQLFVVQTAAATAQARFGSDTAGAKEALTRIRESSREAIGEMDALLTQLRTTPVERTSLVEALRRQCEALEHRTGAKVQLTAGEMPEAGALASAVYENVYRVAQEALHNAGKHARATEVNVRLGMEGMQLVLEIADDGAGFDTNVSQATTAGMGLPNMRQRASESGGVFELWSQPGHGTRVRFAVPIFSIDVREHRRQAWIQAACLAILTGYVVLRSPEPIVVLGLPLAMALGYHLRALWLARRRREIAA